MESIRPCPAPRKNRLAKKFQKFIHLKTSRRNLSNNGFYLKQQEKLKFCESHHFQREKNVEESARESRNRAAMEAFIAKLFATISSVKAGYAELQIAQFPYNAKAMQSADESIVSEIKLLSELKQRFLRKQIDLAPPHVTLMLADIQEQQSLMKTYEITMNKMQNEIEKKESQICCMQQGLSETIQNNKSLEMKLISEKGGSFSVLDSVEFSEVSPKDFILVLKYALRSIRYFVKLLIREMESAKWDVDVAAKAIVPEVTFVKKDDKAFAFESFVCREIFGGFNEASFSIKQHDRNTTNQCRFYFFEQFKKLKCVNAIHFLKQQKTNPNSLFGEFLKSKYLQLVHPKMELSFFGNLNQRKQLVNSGEYPGTEFFKVFAEMGRRIWLLHCLAFSFNEKVSIFQVKKGCRFSQVYMESVTNDELFAFHTAISDIRVGFTVVPGFQFEKMVVQSQVYLSTCCTTFVTS